MEDLAFQKSEPTNEELREFSKEKFAQKRTELAEWIRQLREIQRTDPEKAKNYIPPQKLLERFYEEMREVYEDLPFNKEEIKEQFSAENLSNLSLEEYIALLRKVPPRFILHITRQGVRDRASFHSGRGQISHGFENVLESGAINSVLERCLEGVITKESVRNVLVNMLQIPAEYKNKQEAISRIEDFLTRHRGTNLASSEIADRSALHVSMDYVMSEEYGAEPGNDIFFAYPTAFVASQYNIAAQWGVPEEFNMIKSTMSGQFNDLWIKTKENSVGKMPLEAAIVFIPSSARVDRNTGSKYNINNEGSPALNTEQVDKIKSFLTLTETKEMWPVVYRALYSYQDSKWELRSREKETPPNNQNLSRLKAEVDDSKEVIESFIQKANEYGITDPRFRDTLFDSSSAENSKLVYLLSRCTQEEPFRGMNEFEVDDLFAGAGLTFELAKEERIITSKEYWESYFKQVGKRPSKIIFYDEITPNQALSAFKGKVGLVENLHTGIDLKSMFAENVLDNNRQMHNMMSDEIGLFATYANELLEEMYQGHTLT